MKHLYLFYAIISLVIGVLSFGITAFLSVKNREAVLQDVLRQYLFFFTAFSLLILLMILPVLFFELVILDNLLDVLLLLTPMMYAVISIIFLARFLIVYGHHAHSVLTQHTLKPPSMETICANHNITSREQDVIRLILQGHRNKEISEQLCISVSTVKKYITSIYYKLDLKSRDELITLFTTPLESSSGPLSFDENALSACHERNRK